MGGNIARIAENEKQKQNCPLLDSNPSSQVTITRLREFYGSFKSVCDNLSIDLTEFEQIFGANESSFIIWDTDENGLVDALELFSGLTLMSSSTFDEKVNFLFHLFDFNEVGYLSLTELEFMLDCCLLSIFKIYSVRNDIERDEVGDFIFNNFSEETNISKKRLFTWCCKCNEIQTFFKILKKELSQPVASIKNPRIVFKPMEKVASDHKERNDVYFVGKQGNSEEERADS